MTRLVGGRIAGGHREPRGPAPLVDPRSWATKRTVTTGAPWPALPPCSVGWKDVEIEDERFDSLSAPDREALTPELVSVVIPMYNAAGLIEYQLQALATQRYEWAWEVVVADNGSTDDSVEIAKLYEDRIPSLRLVDASLAKGASHARNVGSRAALGGLILYADADDIVSPNWVASLVDALRHDPFVAGQQRRLLSNGTAAPAAAGDWEKLPVSFDFLPWAFGGNCALWRTAFDQVDGWREDYTHGGDDIDFCWRVQLAGFPLTFVPEAVVYYRQRATLVGLMRQQFEFGARAPLLYREFKSHGAKRRSVKVVIRNWVWVVTRSPYFLLGTERRRAWLATAAGTVGRMWGSARWRQLCL